MMRPVTRLGIPAILVSVIGTAILTLLPVQSGYALEKLIEPLLSAKSGRCKIVVQMKDKTLPPFTFDAMFRGPLGRQENKDMGMIMIMDESKGTIVELHTKEKQARVLQKINRSPEEALEGGFLQQIRGWLAGMKEDGRITQRVSLGERDLADKTLVGYRISGPDGQMDIWGDKTTGLPHSVISNLSAFPNMELTMTDFQFDIELEDSLFSLTPPAGYAVTRDTMDMSLRSEKGFIAALRQAAEINDGVYPDTINAMIGIQLSKKYESRLSNVPEREREKEVNRVRKLLAAGFAFPLQLAAETKASYSGKNVRRSEGKKPIFWYKPAGAEKFRIVLADLSVIDTAEPPQVDNAQQFAHGPAAK